MPKPEFTALLQSPRRDTIGLRTLTKYEPMARRHATPVMAGPHVVMRRPVPDSVHTLYMIMDGDVIVGSAISRPDEHDCSCAIRNHRLRAGSKALSTHAWKQRKPRTLRAKEVA